MWEKTAFIAVHIVNMAGKVVKRPMKLKQLMPKFIDDGKPRKTKEELDREFAEAIRFQKSKCWMAFRGGSLDTIRIFGDNPEEDAKLIEKWKKEGKIRGVLDYFLENKN